MKEKRKTRVGDKEREIKSEREKERKIRRETGVREIERQVCNIETEGVTERER